MKLGEYYMIAGRVFELRSCSLVPRGRDVYEFWEVTRKLTVAQKAALAGEAASYGHPQKADTFSVDPCPRCGIRARTGGEFNECLGCGEAT